MSKNVIIVGCPRSGTSMTTNIFASNGYFVAEDSNTQLRQGDEFNPSGYWEAEPLIRANAEVFSAAGFSFDNTWLYEAISEQQEQQIDALATMAEHQKLVDTYNKNSPWVWKDPRLCYTLQYWWQLMHESTTGVLLLKRDPEQIFQSFLRLKWRDGSPQQKAEGLERIVNHMKAAEATVKRYNIPHLVVHYEEFESSPQQVVQKINAFFGLSLSASDLGYDKKLNHKGLKGRLSLLLDRAADLLPDRVRKAVKGLMPKKLLNLIFPHRY
jgi:hypothetical protein